MFKQIKGFISGAAIGAVVALFLPVLISYAQQHLGLPLQELTQAEADEIRGPKFDPATAVNEARQAQKIKMPILPPPIWDNCKGIVTARLSTMPADSVTIATAASLYEKCSGILEAAAYGTFQ